jgi:alkanesulfonate monooxygenase SsuD/methylene tetrahydromethanopterin reductase-like flavin-dependent oxidoreductase (luciferase family)
MEGEWTAPEQAAVQQMMQFSFIGSAASVRKDLASFVAEANLDEIMIAAHIYDQALKIRSYELVAPFFKQVSIRHAEPLATSAL